MVEARIINRLNVNGDAIDNYLEMLKAQKVASTSPKTIEEIRVIWEKRNAKIHDVDCGIVVEVGPNERGATADPLNMHTDLVLVTEVQ